ncbi:Lar family restriction alleviation protein, partial [Burkholderia cenocepacia]
LLPCPHCGHAAQIMMGTGPFGGRVQVECASCRIATFWFEEAVAVRMWNRRIAASPVEQPAAAPLPATALNENELSAILSASLNSYMTTAERDCLRNLMRRVKAANHIVQPAPSPQPSPADERAAPSSMLKLLEWAVGRWEAEVKNRPLINVHRRSLDDTWRQVIRQCGGDDVSLLGPRHGDLLAANPIKKTDRDPSFIDSDLDFEPSARHAVADMANIGYALLEQIDRMMPGYHWNESPVEIVSDLINERDEARAASANETAAEGATQASEEFRQIALTELYEFQELTGCSTSDEYRAKLAAMAAEASTVPEPDDDILRVCGWEDWLPDGYIDRGTAERRYRLISGYVLSKATPQPAQADARVGLTGEQREAMHEVIRAAGGYSRGLLDAMFFAAPPGQPEPAAEVKDEPSPEWMTCESRRPFVVNSIRAHAAELRDAENRCRNAYRKDFMGIPARYIADACGEAAAVLEARLAAVDAARAGGA